MEKSTEVRLEQNHNGTYWRAVKGEQVTRWKLTQTEALAELDVYLRLL